MSFFVLETMPTGRFQSARTDVLLENGFNKGDAPRCPKCGKFIGMLSWLPPYRVDIETWGKTFGDLAFAGASGWLLGSSTFRTVWEANLLKGLSGFHAVAVLRVKQHDKFAAALPEYFKADVIRNHAEVDQKCSGFEWDESPQCSVCRLGGTIKRWRRVVIAPETWTGEDIFIARGLPGTYIATLRFKQVCEANSIKNAVFYPAESYAHDFYPWEV